VQLLYGPDEIDWVRSLAEKFGGRGCRLQGMPPKLSELVRGKQQDWTTTSASKAHELVRARWGWPKPDRIPSTWAILELRDEQPPPSYFSDDAQRELTRQAATTRATAATARGIPVVLVRRDAQSNLTDPIPAQRSGTEESPYKYVIDLVSDSFEPGSPERGQIEPRVWSLPVGWVRSILEALEECFTEQEERQILAVRLPPDEFPDGIPL
jgi:hypothetical protein